MKKIIIVDILHTIGYSYLAKPSRMLPKICSIKKMASSNWIRGFALAFWNSIGSAVNISAGDKPKFR